MVSFLLSVTFACGLVIAISHVINRRFVAPVYDVLANVTAFGCAVAASLLLGHWIPALLSAIAILCWLALARRTVLARRRAVEGAVAMGRVVRGPRMIPDPGGARQPSARMPGSSDRLPTPSGSVEAASAE